VFLIVDLAFFGANIVKVAQGGWFPLVMAAATFVIFASWRRGRAALSARLAQGSLPPRLVIDDVALRGIPRTPGTAVFLTGQATGTPPALLHNLKHNRVVHDRNVFLTVRNEEVPHVPEAERSSVEELGQGFDRVIARYGFMEDPDIPAVLRGIGIEPDRTTFFLSRSTVLSRRKGLIGSILDRLFIFMGRNAQVPTQFFRLPPNRVIEIGMQVEI
jgi:KUP system potassium uptake protein